MVNLSVYISETCQWRDIGVRFELQRPSKDGYIDGHWGGHFVAVVCQGMVCIHNGDYFGAFNPSDVTDTFQGTLKAINLPFPAGVVHKLFESDGNLVAFEDTCITLRSNFEGKLAEHFSEGKRIWKLDMRPNNDIQLRQWELISELNGHINVKGSVLTPPDRYGFASNDLAVVGVHPSKEHLVYLVKRDSNAQHRFILYDTKSKSLEALPSTIPPHDISRFYKLDIPCWRTPIPIPL